MIDSTAQSSELAGRTAVVTGAARGIGLGISRKLAEAGATVWMVDRDESAATAAAAAVAADGWLTRAHGADVGDLDAVERMAERMGAIPDVLVNNAGIIRPA